MKLWWYLFHGWLGSAAGSVVCWWKGDHVEVLSVGFLSPWGARFEETAHGFSLNPDPDAPSNVYWERTYCARCGVTLKDEMS